MPFRLRLDGGAAFSLAVALLFLWALWQSRTFGLRAGLFPWAVTIPALGLAIVQLGRELTGRREEGDVAGIETEPHAGWAGLLRPTAEIAAWILGMFVAICLVGFPAATLLTTFLYLKLGTREPWPMSVALSFGGFAFVYGLFERALGVPFPPGSLLAWLGYD